MSEIIRLENVVKMAPNGRRAINDVSLVVHERECVLICGAPGSGKSTLMRLIAGMDAPSSGKVFVTGKPVHEMDMKSAAAFRNRIFGICLRNPSLMQRLPVWENVALPFAIRGVPTAQRKQAAMEQLKTLGIAYAAHAYPTLLSAYEAQVVSLARALVTHPAILMMDEMTTDLPEKDAEQLMGILNALCQFGKATVLIFTAVEICMPFSRHLTLDNGKPREENQ